MKPVLLYLLQVICCSGLLYGYYHLLLRNKKFHLYNRYYLLAAAVISILVPFLNIPVYFSSADTKPLWLYSFNDISDAGFILTAQGKQVSPVLFTWNNALILLYVLVSLFVAYRFIAAILAVRKMISKYQVEKLESVYFVNTDEKGTPFSFFRWLFWNKKIQLDSPDGQQILRHELFHIKQKHSIDIVFIEILSVVFWINPFFHLIKKELTTIHEFLADQFAVNENEKWNYAEMLLMHLLGTPSIRLTHPFFHNQIKRRIAMITSSQKPKYQYFRKVLALPLLIIVAALFAFTYKQKQQPASREKKADIVITEDASPQIIEVALTDTPPKVRGVKIVKDDVIEEKIRLDGKYTTVGDKAPLYVIDNVVISKDKGASPLRAIEPDNIKVINVLKDKSALDKYGPDAINGVIEIITKEGKTLKLTLDNVKVEGLQLKEVEGKQLPANFEVREDRKKVEGKELAADALKEVTVVGYATRKAPEASPSFPGGQTEWRKYLERNLNANVPVDNGAPAGQYTVWTKFVVDAEGNLSDIKATTEHGYGMEAEVIRIIKAGPKWVPATVDGKAVSAYRKQPVTFVITDEPDTETESPVLEEVVVNGYGKTKPLTETDIAKLNPLYPNPANNNVTIMYNSEISGQGEIRVQDLTGKTYKVDKINIAKGVNTLNVNVSSLTKGMFLITVVDVNKKPARVYKLMKE
jgi:beta-lactamase regulating signal transducer with metallopeptidase domain